jgi:transposase
VVFLGKGKAASSLDPFWRRLNRTKPKIEAVAIDMSQAYIQAVRERLPKAVLVFDHCHVIKLFNEKLTELSRDLYREITDFLKKNVLKGVRRLLLKNPENLDPERNECTRLKQALRLNEPLACAHYMKKDLRMIWKQRDKAEARHSLDDWIARAEVSGIGILQAIAELR